MQRYVDVRVGHDCRHRVVPRSGINGLHVIAEHCGHHLHQMLRIKEEAAIRIGHIHRCRERCGQYVAQFPRIHGTLQCGKLRREFQARAAAEVRVSRLCRLDHLSGTLRRHCERLIDEHRDPRAQIRQRILVVVVAMARRIHHAVRRIGTA